jgi:hypothetical protein
MAYRPYHIFGILITLLTGLTTCRQVYAPPAITRPNRFLVVDGIVNTSPNAVSTVNLNRTRNLGDTTVTGIPELHAELAIIGSNGVEYPLYDTAGTGVYKSAPLSLDVTKTYYISIRTADGHAYASDPVRCEPTPPIDSVYWRQPSDLTIYISTHDPAGSTHYYRYDYNETWEHDSEWEAIYGVSNHYMFAVDSTNQLHRCWTTDSSHGILLTSSAAETQDVISGYPLLTIPNSDNRLTRAYSILVRQYALTEDAYNYWQLIQKTTQNVGSLFDLQPTQLSGNIHCTTNPAEPVIGFLSACAVQQQRIGIIETSLHNWIHNEPAFGCDTLSIPFDFYNPFAYNYPDTNYAPYYFDGTALVLGSAVCLNCLLFGGTNIHPTFMPE